MPNDPSRPAPDEPGLPSPERRSLLAAITAGIAGVTALAVGIPFVGFLFGPLKTRARAAWRVVGRAEEFAPGATVKVDFRDPAPEAWSGAAGSTAAWLRQEPGGRFVAFSSFCTHVGCPVRWVEGARLFICPCHGGAFDADGNVAAGPPTRPLDRYAVRVRDGVVELRAEGVPLPGSRG